MRFFIVFLFLTIFLTVCSNEKNITPGKAFHILYISNLNGAIESCECGDPPLGGLSKIAAVVNDYRKKYKNVVFVDGGDAFNSYPYKQLNTAVADAFKIIQPDIWAIAEQEFVDGYDFFESQISKSNIRFLAGNYTVKNLLFSKEYSVDTGTDKIVFKSYLQPELVKDELKADKIQFQGISGIEDVRDDVFNILLFHGTEKDYLLKKNILKKYNLILLAHQAVPIFDPDAKPAVFGGLFDGEKILHISLHKSGSGFKINAGFIEIFQSIESDPAVEKIVEDYLLTLQK